MYIIMYVVAEEVRQLKQLASDYSQQKHTTWADNYC